VLPVSTALLGRWIRHGPEAALSGAAGVVAVHAGDPAVSAAAGQAHRIDPESLRRGIIAEIVTSAMFAIASSSPCWCRRSAQAMFLLVLSGPIQALFARGRVSRKGRTAQDSAEHG
jgi:hypothetical protein